MFTKKVTDDDKFMALSASAQALYLHLSMASDDDGFCNQVSVSMFKAHASVQDLKALLEARYIYQFENGVIVVKHWRMANALRKDRYTPTIFQEELAKLKIKNDGSYLTKEEQEELIESGEGFGCQMVASWLPVGCQVVAERLPQDRLGKDRIGKDKKDNIQHAADEAFERLWKLYPNKKGKASISNAQKRKILNEIGEEQFARCIQRYVQEHNELLASGKFCPEWKHGSSFFNKGYDDYLDKNYTSQDQDAENNQINLPAAKKEWES